MPFRFRCRRCCNYSPFPPPRLAGALITTLAIYRLATIGGRTIVATLLLAGIALNALAQSFSGFLTFYATDTQIRSLTFWKLGSLGNGSWTSVLAALPFILIPILLFSRLARPLNALLLGEAEAGHLGFEIEKIKRQAIILAALSVGASVAFTGLITFVGLVVPHLLRLIIGPDHRYLFPASALLGATLLLTADLVARTLVSPAEMPIGILTAMIGAPFFLWLLIRSGRGVWRIDSGGKHLVSGQIEREFTRRVAGDAKRRNSRRRRSERRGQVFLLKILCGDRKRRAAR